MPAIFNKYSMRMEYEFWIAKADDDVENDVLLFAFVVVSFLQIEYTKRNFIYVSITFVGVKEYSIWL